MLSYFYNTLFDKTEGISKLRKGRPKGHHGDDRWSIIEITPILKKAVSLQ